MAGGVQRIEGNEKRKGKGMKTGKTLTDLAKELERQLASRVDYVRATETLNVATETVVDTAGVKATVPQILIPRKSGENVMETFGIRPHARQQLRDLTKVPKDYDDRMLQQEPELWAASHNTWLHRLHGKRQMVRTLDGFARGIVSDRYRCLDNFDLAERGLPILSQKKAEIVSCDLTETRMYIKAIIPSMVDEVKNGLPVNAGIVLQNSEVGAGSFGIFSMIWTQVCSNGAIVQKILQQYHIGKRVQEEEFYGMLRDETRKADDHAFWLKVQDLIGVCLSDKVFATNVANAKEAAGHKIAPATSLDDLVDVALSDEQVSEKTKNSILHALVEGGDLSQWGLSSAITLASQKVEDYEEATALERLGGEVIELSKGTWHEWLEAAEAA